MHKAPFFRNLLVAWLVSATLFVCHQAKARVIYVDVTASNTPDGSKWSTAYRCLQDALATASYGDEIHVAAGTYRPDRAEFAAVISGDRTAAFALKSGVIVEGGFAGSADPRFPSTRDLIAYQTILSGDLAGNDTPVDVAEQLEQESTGRRADNSYHIVMFDNAGATAVLDGFTITGGSDPRSQGGRGGGIYASMSNLTVSNCIVRENYSSGEAAGIYASGVGSVVVEDCVFLRNYAQILGAAISTWNASLSLDRCRFSENASPRGGAIRASNADKVLVNDCSFDHNTAHAGGALYIDTSDATLTDCRFFDNQASMEGGAVLSGISGALSLTNCLLVRNTAPGGGGVWAGTSPTDITDCTFFDNSADEGCSVCCQSRSTSADYDLRVRNCILWDDDPELYQQDPASSVSAAYCCVAGGWPGDGNLDLYPQFVDPANDDYTLMPESPCLDAGFNPAVPVGITTDIDGHLRIANGVVDIGAFEALGPRVVYVDANADGKGDGTSWVDAANRLQDGLAMASTGSTPVQIRVAGGLYHPDNGVGLTPGDRAASFVLKDEMTLIGGYAGSTDPNAPDRHDPALFETVLSGDLLGNDADVNTVADLLQDTRCLDNSYHVVRCDQAELGVQIESLTIRSGRADTPAGQFYPFAGGGLLTTTGKLALVNVTVCNNSVLGDYAYGAGIYSGGQTRMADCVIENNIAYGSEFGSGGGMYAGDSLELDNCTFRANVSQRGGGLQTGSTVDINECLFAANAAILLGPDTSGESVGGGGMYASGGWGQSSVTRCLFIGNIGGNGGGLQIYEAEPVITNCLFAGNSADGNGGAIECDTYPCDVELVNCTLADNNATDYGGAIFAGDEAKPHLVNCILWGNIASLGPQIATQGDSLVWIDYTDLQGGLAATLSCDAPEDPAYITWGVGNIDVDPCFAAPADRDYYLKSQAGRYWLEHNVWVLDNQTSACIDAGDPYTDPSAEPMPNGRRINLGAYGATPQASRSNNPGLIGDLNHDGIVDFKDMAIMVENWLERQVIPPPPGD